MYEKNPFPLSKELTKALGLISEKRFFHVPKSQYCDIEDEKVLNYSLHELFQDDEDAFYELVYQKAIEREPIFKAYSDQGKSEFVNLYNQLKSLIANIEKNKDIETNAEKKYRYANMFQI